MENYKLIIDTREKHVSRHIDELKNINHSIVQITTGDYALLFNGEIKVIFERKSLDDYGASFKDGRHENKQKLINLRNLIGCRIIYIVEGPLAPKSNDEFGGIPYAFIESSIYHLMVRDNISVIRTQNSLETAQMLVRFFKSMQKLEEINTEINTEINKINKNNTKINTEIHNETENSTENATKCGGENVAIENPQDALALLTAKHQRSEDEIVRTMWACFKGISVESAIEYMRKWSIAEIVRGHITADEINGFKLKSGRKICKNAALSLQNISTTTQIKLLSTIPGISKVMATTLIDTTPLSRLLSYNNEISFEIVGKNSRRLGAANAEKVVKYFNYKLKNE